MGKRHKVFICMERRHTNSSSLELVAIQSALNNVTFVTVSHYILYREFLKRTDSVLRYSYIWKDKYKNICMHSFVGSIIKLANVESLWWNYEKAIWLWEGWHLALRRAAFGYEKGGISLWEGRHLALRRPARVSVGISNAVRGLADSTLCYPVLAVTRTGRKLTQKLRKADSTVPLRGTG